MPRLFLLFCFLLITLVGCTPSTYTKVWFELDPTTPSSQSKENVTIEVEYIGKTFQEMAKFSPFWVSKDVIPDVPFAMYQRTSNENTIFYEFPGTCIFSCNIMNETGHILRMRDARVYFVTDDDNIPGVQSKEDLFEIGAPETRVGWFTLKEEVIKNRKLKLINDLKMEILPGQSANGFLFFDVEPEKATIGALNFYDITTETDAAGNPTKKTQFTFKIIKKIAVITR